MEWALRTNCPFKPFYYSKGSHFVKSIRPLTRRMTSGKYLWMVIFKIVIIQSGENGRPTSNLAPQLFHTLTNSILKNYSYGVCRPIQAYYVQLYKSINSISVSNLYQHLHQIKELIANVKPNNANKKILRQYTASSKKTFLFINTVMYPNKLGNHRWAYVLYLVM